MHLVHLTVGGVGGDEELGDRGGDVVVVDYRLAFNFSEPHAEVDLSKRQVWNGHSGYDVLGYMVADGVHWHVVGLNTDLKADNAVGKMFNKVMDVFRIVEVCGHVGRKRVGLGFDGGHGGRTMVREGYRISID